MAKAKEAMFKVTGEELVWIDIIRTCMSKGESTEFAPTENQEELSENAARLKQIHGWTPNETLINTSFWVE